MLRDSRGGAGKPLDKEPQGSPQAAWARGGPGGMTPTVTASGQRKGGAQWAGRGRETDPWALTCLCRSPHSVWLRESCRPPAARGKAPDPICSSMLQCEEGGEGGSTAGPWGQEAERSRKRGQRG